MLLITKIQLSLNNENNDSKILICKIDLEHLVQ